MLAVGSPGQGTRFLALRPPYRVELWFRHSVEGCPVREVFDVSEGDFFLAFTEFSSTGAGLPSEGPGFRWSDGFYHIAGDGRRFPSLAVQPHPSTGHRLIVGERVLPLEPGPAGGAVILKVHRLPWWLVQLMGYR